ncbi:MAG TPA: tripartite tricarboxylate transporter substrate binding protein [Xanthobacteraceae bacterium]|jgi:tripartite-type tricarboxylate transporter receptor subunit TctC
MTLCRRTFLLRTAGAASVAAMSHAARAQAYPTRPVRIISGFPPGGSNDIYARLMAQWLSERLGQQFIVENRSGAGGTLGAEAAAKAAPDGYTLLLSASGEAWNASLYPNLKFNYMRDFAPVGTIARGVGLLVVTPSLPVRTVLELIEAAKAGPGKIGVASAGIGSAPYMYWELFKSLTGVDMVHVPYRGGGPALTDLLGGQVQVYFSTMVSSIEHVRAGRLRAIAVTGANRAKVLPDIPTVGETVHGYEASSWWGISAPKGAPSEIVERLSKEIRAAVADPRIRARISQVGDTPLASSPAEFAKLIKEDTEKWAKVIRAAGIKAE